MMLMLDTNTVNDLVRSNETVTTHLQKHPPQDVVLSCVSEGELRYGLAKNPQARLRSSIETFMGAAQILPWDSKAASCYGILKHQTISQGRPLTELDLMIAAHALSIGATLISSDKALLALSRVGISVVNWRLP